MSVTGLHAGELPADLLPLRCSIFGGLRGPGSEFLPFFSSDLLPSGSCCELKTILAKSNEVPTTLQGQKDKTFVAYLLGIFIRGREGRVLLTVPTLATSALPPRASSRL